MLRILVIAILLYFAYVFIFRFIIPVYITSRRLKKGFQEMQDRMHQQMKQEQDHEARVAKQKEEEKQKPGKGDYLEFEEIK